MLNQSINKTEYIVTTWYLHADLDAFFASVEQLDHPEYRGKPVIVGGLPTEKRSVVSTASYEARKYGVHSAMPTIQAFKLCPHGIYIHGNYQRYSQVSCQIMEIFSRYSPEVIQMSIDEAFINLTGTEKLFGPPEETAMKIKKAVKDETGLTVSIGLADSKYFAKLSSEINKPDGFFFMKPGSEQEFMLSRPIEKIWGIGQKTSERIKKSGIKTTRELYQRSLDSLVFMFGQGTGTFLYNIIRGNSDGTFSEKSQTHSISNERTFPIDITDYYTAETYLMELAHSVMFRLLKEKGSSRTVVIKIRYEDFTTVSSRQTYTQRILTLDSFSEKIKDLFKGKYEYGRGIRLLGVGFDNVEFGDVPYQRDLFDNIDEKKQAVEKAILKLEEKYPNLALKKARTLKPADKLKTFLIIPLLLFSGLMNKAEAESYNKASIDGAGTLSVNMTEIPLIPKEAPDTLFDFKLGDSEVEFNTTGYWNAVLDGNITFPIGQSPSFSVPVFKQDVDLTAELFLNKKWFFKTSFADNFNKNTFSLGYNGDGVIRKALISNRGIDFPKDYSASTFGYGLSGGENQAPGFSLSLRDSFWQADFMARYDMINRKSQIFYGKNKVSNQTLNVNEYISGKYFSLPEKLLKCIDSVYTESISGTIYDSQNRKYKKLSENDYYIVSEKNTIVLLRNEYKSSESIKEKKIVISFNSVTENELSKMLGSYPDKNTWLGNIQEVFSNNGKINLDDYSYPLIEKIENKAALVIQSPEGFSPFSDLSHYDFGLSDNADFSIDSKSTGNKLRAFSISPLDLIYQKPGDDFFKTSTQIVTVSQTAPSDFNNKASLRFPFASINASIYLTDYSDTDIVLNKRSYSSIPYFQIPKDIAENSVVVTINGKSFQNFSYDPKTGIVAINKNITSSDQIVIFWNEDSTDFLKGALSIGTGFRILPFENFSTDITLNLFWPLYFQNKYHDIRYSDDQKTGFIAVSSGIEYKPGNWTLSDKWSASIESENISGNLLVYSAEPWKTATYYLEKDNGYKSFRVPLKKLSEKNKGTLGSLDGLQHPSVSGYVIPVDFTFTQNESEEDFQWVSANIKLNKGNLISSGTTFELAVLPETELENYIEVYLQFGVNAEDDSIQKNELELPYINITDQIFNTDLKTSSKWKIIEVPVDDVIRTRTKNYHDIRIIIVNTSKEPFTTPITGKLLIGPYETVPLSGITENTPFINTNISTVQDISAPSQETLQKTESYITQIKWDTKDTSNNNSFTFCHFFPETSISSYEELVIPFSISSKDNNLISALSISFRFFGRKADSDKPLEVLSLRLNEAFTQKLIRETENQVSWNIIKIKLNEQKVFVNNEELSIDDFNLFYLPSCIISELRITADTGAITKGILSLDSIYFCNSKPQFVLQNIGKILYQSESAIFSVKDFPVLSKPFLLIESLQKTSPLIKDRESSFVTGAISTGITLTKMRLETDINTKSQESNFLFNAGHNIQTENPLFKVISISENYRFAPENIYFEKNNSLKIDFSEIAFPLAVSFNTTGLEDFWYQKQKASGGLSLAFLPEKWKMTFESNANFSQKTFSSSDRYSKSDYFSKYGELTENQFSTGEDSSEERISTFDISMQELFPIFSLAPAIKLFFISDYEKFSSKQKSTLKELITIPAKLGNQSFSFEWMKITDRIHSNPLTNSYIDDTTLLFTDTGEKSWFYGEFIFYDLFDKDLSQKVSDSKKVNISRETYVSNYSISWKRPLFQSFYDLFVPYSASLIFERNIENTNVLSDFYQAKLDLSQTSINIFGSKSMLNFFKWYETDEMSSGLSISLRLPQKSESDLLWETSIYNQILLFMNTDTSIKTASDFTFDTNNNWNYRFTGIYSYKTQRKKTDKNKKHNIFGTHKEALNLNLGMTDSGFIQEYQISHTSDIHITGNFTITGSLNTTYRKEETGNQSVKLNYSMGGKMAF